MDQRILWLLWAVALMAAVFAFSYAVRLFAFRIGAVDEPKGGRKIHEKVTALLGGWAIGLPLLLALSLLNGFGFFEGISHGRISTLQISGILAGVAVILIGGAIDDRYDLKPHWQILFPLAAGLLVVLTGTQITHVTNLVDGKPFLLSYQPLLTMIWLMAVMYATKFMDGIDGLVTGQTAIGAAVIAALALSQMFYQPAVAVIALLVCGAFLGFLPHAWHPAKQFLGESGSILAGFLLGVLAILGSTKLATGLMALALPLTDAAIVVMGRVARGHSPFRGDDTHLHFKLLRAGLSQQKVVLVMWGLSLACGIAALFANSSEKILLILILFVMTFGLSRWAGKQNV